MYDLSPLRYCWSAGDLLPTEIYNEWKEKVGVPSHHVCGSTEMVVYSVSSRSPTASSAASRGSASAVARMFASRKRSPMATAV